MRRLFYFQAIFVLVLLGGCSSGLEDLEAYVNDVDRSSRGHIDPIPTYPPYEVYSYKAMALRSPFTKQVEEDNSVDLAAQSSVKPDEERVKEYLEKFGFESLNWVGTYEQGGVLWALIDDSVGSVQPVKKGNYLGRNHGRILSINSSEIQVLEIVPNGSGAWLERPRTIRMVEK